MLKRNEYVIKSALTNQTIFIFTEAQDVSTVYDAKYMEVSAGINHNIDELLVGILALIKYKLNPSLPPPTLRVDKKKPGVSRFSFKAPIDFFSRMYQLARDKFRPARKTK